MASAAAAPDHTVVLVQASCPSLPNDASLAASCAQPRGAQVDRKHVLHPAEESEHRGEIESDFDGDGDEDDDRLADERAALPGGICTTSLNGVREPLTLKQQCEMVLARKVDLLNAVSLFAYADALDAPGLVKYCAEFVCSNLDGILVMGRESDRCCLLETTGELVRWYFRLSSDCFTSEFAVGINIAYPLNVVLRFYF